MYLITTIALIAAGLVGAAPIVVRRAPELSNTIEFIRKYSSIIGIYLLVTGILYLIRALGGASLGLFGVASVIAMVGLGFLQGFEFVMELFRNNAKLMNQTQDLRFKLIKYQETLGILAIIVAIVRIIR